MGRCTLEVTMTLGLTGLLPDSAGCDTVRWLDDGMLWLEDNEIHLRPCQDCNCTAEGESYRIALGDVIPPPLPFCGHIGLWESQSDDGCRWGGLVLFYAGEVTLPDYVVSNQRNLPSPPLVSAGVAVGLEPVETCEFPAACPEDPGRHALVFGPSTVEVGPPQVVDIPFVANNTPFWVTNRMSSAAPNCSQRVAWVGEIEI